MNQRLRMLLPGMVLLNLGHLVLTVPGGPLRTGYAAVLQQWADAVFVIHGVTAVLASVLCVLVYRRRASALHLGVASALLYQLHAAAIAGADQLNSQTIVPYVGYAIVNAVVVVMTVRQAAALFIVSGLAVGVAISLTPTTFPAGIAVFPTALSVAVPALCIVWFLNRSREDAFYYEDTIARQSAELAVLNEDLRGQVELQVAALVSRSHEVQALNDELRTQVNDRSQELAVALGRLAQHEPLGRALEGQQLAGRFVLGREIGAGGMGRVYAGVDLHHDREVAVKLLDGRGSRAAMERFLREVQSATMLRHPAIVRMLHVDITEDGRLFQVQERVQGRSLAQWLGRVRQFDLAPILHILHDLTDALAAAHTAGVIHRDVKPSNVMLITDPPGLKLLDFGVAKLALDEPDGLTRTGRLLGTPAFLAPELWSGSDRVSPASDFYALGVTIYQLLTGELPRLGDLEDVPLNRREDLPASLVNLLRSLLLVDPRQRPNAQRVMAVTGPLCDDLPSLDELVATDRIGALRTMERLPPTHLSFT